MDEFLSLSIFKVSGQHVQYSFMSEVKAALQGGIWGLLKPKSKKCLVRVLLFLCVRKTLCDVYITCHESHFISIL